MTSAPRMHRDWSPTLVRFRVFSNKAHIELKKFDPLAQCNSDAEYDTDIEDDAATYGPDVDDPYGISGRLS